MLSQKFKIGVLMGGPSAEHEVSLKSGENVERALKENNFSALPLKLTQDLVLSSEEKFLPFPATLGDFDIIFNALHGTFGEDGQIQKILDDLGVPYTGSGVEASQLGMDKWLSRGLFQKEGIATPYSQLSQKNSKLKLKITFPSVVKPRDSGSSDRVFIVKSNQDLEQKLNQFFIQEEEVIIEEYLKGREFTCGVLEIKGEVMALPVVEIQPQSNYEFFNYEAKYTPGATAEIVPASIEKKLAQEIQQIALTAHKSINCRVYSRSDFILSNNKLYLLEINTQPGLTKNSLLPKAAAAAGISFPNLIETILLSSLSYF